jgi:transcriptional regulator with XRE-family HTH domain
MPLNENYVKELGKHIDKLRQERNLSYQEMADRCDMDKAQVHKICTQGKDLRVSTIIKIANGLRVSISAVLDIE